EYNDSDPYDYITKEFNVTMVFDESHTATVTEEIKVNFIQSHHGITRNIPLATDNTYEVKNVSVAGYNYNVEETGNNTMIRIGDADRYLSGDQTFVISYKIEYYKDTDSFADYLAQNLLPTEWDTSIRNATLVMTMPSEIDWTDMQIYAGKYGASSTTAWEEYFTKSVKGNTITLTGVNLPKGYGVTLRDTNLPDGYWSGAVDFLEAHKYITTGVIIIAVITALLAFLMWYKNGRDEKIIETIEFYPPNNMTPAEVGYALDGSLEDSEMMTMVFYMADKGYLTIEQEKKNFLLKKGNPVPDSEPTYIKTFINGLFKKKDVVDTKRVSSSFRSSFDSAKSQVKTAYAKKYGEVFEAKSSICRYTCLVLALINMAALCILHEGFEGIFLAAFPVVAVLLGAIIAWKGYDNISTKSGGGKAAILIGGIIYLIGTCIACLFYLGFPSKLHLGVYFISQMIIFIFSFVMQKRSKENTELMGKLYGFRTFIKEAEYDRIVALCDEDPQYFYHILPYAAVLGLETAWTKHFEKIHIPEPTWYVSDAGDFVYSAVWCNRILNACTRTAIPTPPSSGSSGGYSGGFSGGGFSGGGGGGGGGGAW
ncbi:MAG: DUF2207 domain-containing protein, partial [Lachnospiraceae bacterium]|nr:DUF2207 domain-containing protein [Lachnospiraceae bacterium]